MSNISIHYIAFELCLTEKEEAEEQKEERKMTKWKFSRLVFSTLRKVKRTYSVVLAIK